MELLSVISERDDLLGEDLNVDKIELRNVHAHRSTSAIADRLSLGRVHDDLFHRLEKLVGWRRQVLTHLDEANQLAVLVVVVHKSNHLGEVVAVPLAHSHGEGVDVLVQLVDKSNRL